MDDEPGSPLNEQQHTPTIQHSQSSYMQEPTIAPPLISSSPWRLAYVSAASFPALGALGVALLLLLVFISLRRRGTSSRGSSIILTGPPDAGKTAIHSALVFQQVLPTHTTLQANISFIHVLSPEKEKPQIMRLVDVPGHPRIRDQFKEYLPDAKAVVFVVDSSTIARNGAAVAEHLHHVLHALTSLPPSHNPPPLVILAHKCDLVSTSSSTSSNSSNATLAVSRVRTILERELDKRRTSQAGGVGVAQLGEKDDSDSALGGLECIGTDAGGFRFKDWEGGNVEILGSFVKVTRDTTEKDNDVLSGLKELGEWLQASQ